MRQLDNILDLEQFISTKRVENQELHNIISLEQYKKAMLSEGKKKSPHSKEDWWSDCISEVKTLICTDKTSTNDNLRDKVSSYTKNYFASHPELTVVLDDKLIEEIADEIADELDDVEFDTTPLASHIAQKDRDKIDDNPENRFIRLR